MSIPDYEYAAVVEVAPGFQLDAMTVVRVDRVESACRRKARVTFQPAPPRAVLGKEDVSLAFEVPLCYEEVLSLIEAARYDAWLEHGGPEPEDLR